MMATHPSYAEQIYAGVLGKIIGVYLGRPVEGWPYGEIQNRLGELNFYANTELGEPLIVADDDVSGTFSFGRAMEDHRYPSPITAHTVGETWLNYIIENRTILWWGGLGRSTEHTAYLRLKHGVEAPASGSIEWNGPTLPEQVGAQIFSDAFAMAYPGDPDRAAAAVRAAASVSHDGVALDAAAFLGAMRALAFDVRDPHVLIDRCRSHVHDRRLMTAIDEVPSVCDKFGDWREVREEVDRKFGYALFNGPCHSIPNLAMSLAALILGGDSFQRSVMIAASAGFDTDSNAGVVGCINGIRLGLDAITAQVDLRAPVADRMLVVSSDGGSCVTDAVREARRIIHAAQAHRSEAAQSAPRFGFEFRGSVQGFQPCPVHRSPGESTTSVMNASAIGDLPGLLVRCVGVGPGVFAAASTPLFPDPAEQAHNFSTIASPTLYAGQVVRLSARTRVATDASPTLRAYVLYRDRNGVVSRFFSDPMRLSQHQTELTWQVPRDTPTPLVRFGFLIEAERRFDGDVRVDSIDWHGAPRDFTIDGILLTSIWDTHPPALSAWVSSAANFEADFSRTFSVSHPDGTALATIGTTDWEDYVVSSTVLMSLHKRAGLVARSVGHRRYYAAVFEWPNILRIVKQRDHRFEVLAEAPFEYRFDEPHRCELACVGSSIVLRIDGECIASVEDPDEPYLAGGAGYLIDTGTMLASEFAVRAIPTKVNT